MPQSLLWFVLILISLGIAFFLPGLGAARLFDWDEINFAEAAREMLVTGDYLRVQIDFQPFWEKPPLFFWLQALSFHAFGVNEFSARFPNALIGIFTILSIFWIGRRLQSAAFGWIWALSYFGSLLPHFYFRSGLIDPVFNLFIFWSVASIAFYYLEKKLFWIFLAGAACGLGVLSKGPVALLMTGLTWSVLYFSFIRSLRFPWKEAFLFLLTLIATSSVWFLVEWKINGPHFIQEFLTYQIRLMSIHDAGHKGFPGYHLVVLLLGCFPASIFCIEQFFSKNNLPAAQSFFQSWMKILLFVVLIVFSLVKTKILHYSSLAYFPLTYLAALAIYERIAQTKFQTFFGPTLIAFLVLGTLIATAISVVPTLMSHPEPILNWIKDPFARANLEDHTQWSGREYFIGIFYQIGLVTAAYFMTRKTWAIAFHIFVFSTAITVFSVTSFILPKIERATQGSAVDFYSALQFKNAYVEPYGFKSYAHLFYSRKSISINTLESDQQRRSGNYKSWLLSGKTDLPVYLVSRVTSQQDLLRLPNFKKIAEKNGYALFEAPAKPSSPKK